jgi:hypothetical protein
VLDTETLAGVLIAAVEADADAREVWRAKGSAYFQQRSRELPDALAATAKAQAKLVQARRRVEAAQRRTDTRGWVVARRERTRHLIELGGLVQKAGLVELTDDDRATLYGAMLDLAARVRGNDAGDILALWKRRGKRAFEAEADDGA